MIHYNIFPDKVILVPFSRIMDGTVTSFDSMLSDPDAWLSPKRPEDGITIAYSGEQEDFEEAGSNGVLVLKDSLNKRKGVELTINLGRWNFEIEQLARGGKAGDVATDQTASIEGADDATGMQGLGYATKLQTEKHAVLLQMPANKDDGQTLYYLLPKMGCSVDEREQSLNHTQQANALTMKAYGLETSNPDELTPVQAIYSEATDDGLVFPLEGAKDVV